MVELVCNLDQPNPRAHIPNHYVTQYVKKTKTHTQNQNSITIDYKNGHKFLPSLPHPSTMTLPLLPSRGGVYFSTPCIWAWTCDLASGALANMMQAEV